MTQTPMSSSSINQDVLEFLISQHGQVRQLMDQVRDASPAQRQEHFDALREMLARHETAEEMVVRPLTRKVPGGDAIADQRMNEENEAKRVLADLESMDAATDEFMSAFTAFRGDVLKHAEAEEQQEFSALRTSTSEDQLVSARATVERAEKTAPTHPHPSAKTTTMNYVAGPFAAMLDRARDAFGKRAS